MYLPRSPYLPPGTLREVLAYPLNNDAFKDERFGQALQKLDLSDLIPILDSTKRWDHELSEDEQQSVAFARALLHAPPWILIDEALDGLDENTRQRILEVMGSELQQTGILYVGRAPADSDVFKRTLHLGTDPSARKLADYAAGRVGKTPVDKTPVEAT